MARHNKILFGLALFFVFFCFPDAYAQDDRGTPSASHPPPPPPVRNFHQWGAVTLFNGLPSDIVRAIAQTPDGVLWFGTDGGLARFDGRRVQTASMGNAEPERVIALEATADGTLWIGTQNGVVRYRGGKFQRIEGTQDSAVTAILFGGDGAIYLASENGRILKITETIESSFRVEKIPDQSLAASDGQPLKITSLTEIGGKPVAGTRSRSILLIEENRTFETFGKARPFFVNSLAKDESGRIWLGADSRTAESGLFFLEDDVARPQRIGEGLGNVLSIKPAAPDSLWVGTQNSGIFRFQGLLQHEQFTFENTAGGLRSNTIYALLVDREGVLWIGTNRGVCRYDASSPFNKTLSENVNSNFVRTLFRTRDGRVFAGTNRGLFRLSDGNWVEEPGFTQKVIYALGENSSGELLVGTPGGLFSLDLKQRQIGDVRAVAGFQGKSYAAVFGAGIIQLESQTQIAAGPPQPTTLFADGDKLWIGTAKNGVFVFDGRETKQEKALDSLSGAVIRKIGKDAVNNYWFAGERGLFLFEGGKLEKIIPDQIVRDVVVDGNDLWAATEEGGLRHARRDETFGWLVTELNVEQGLPSQKTFSILPTGAGRLLIATNRGIVDYVPSKNPPKIIATRVLSQRLHSPEESARTIALDYPQNSLLVEVSGLSSRTFPEQFQHGFLLKNAGEEILEKRLSGDSQFTAANLPAGEYSIEARVFNKDLVASEPLVIRFAVAPPPFPKTEAALGVLLTITVIALIWAVVEHQRMLQRNRQLAAARFDLANEAERERKRIARDLHDQTLADLRKLMLMSDKLPSDTSEFRSEIESVSTEIRRICEDLSPSVLENVGLLAALEFLLSQTFENYSFSADKPEEDLNFSTAVQMQIYRITQEVLTNVKRHGNAKSVLMKINISGTEGLVLRIEDDGTGFDLASMTPKGRGIANIKARAALIKAEIGWVAGEKGGTIFEMKKSY